MAPIVTGATTTIDAARETTTGGGEFRFLTKQQAEAR
jgi:hypothetical protein